MQPPSRSPSASSGRFSLVITLIVRLQSRSIIEAELSVIVNNEATQICVLLVVLIIGVLFIVVAASFLQDESAGVV
jgi:hypothetical protein